MTNLDYSEGIGIERGTMTNKNEGKVAVVAERPECDFNCGYEAKIDGRTTTGAWAYMCLRHWNDYGVGKLGTGYGQKLALASK